MAKTADKLVLGILVILLLGMGSVMIAAVDSKLTAQDAERIATSAVSGTVSEVELESQDGQEVFEVEVQNGNVGKEVIVNQQGHIVSIEDEEIDVPITGNALDQASAAALRYIGEGRVTDSEVGDEEGYYEIEVTLDNGGEVDVHLDGNFNVLSVEYD